MTKILLGVCLGIGWMTYSDDIKYKFVESGWRDKIVSNLMSQITHTHPVSPGPDHLRGIRHIIRTMWSNRTKRESFREVAQIAKNQTVMVVCNP